MLMHSRNASSRWAFCFRFSAHGLCTFIRSVGGRQCRLSRERDPIRLRKTPRSLNVHHPNPFDLNFRPYLHVASNSGSLSRKEEKRSVIVIPLSKQLCYYELDFDSPFLSSGEQKRWHVVLRCKPLQRWRPARRKDGSFKEEECKLNIDNYPGLPIKQSSSCSYVTYFKMWCTTLNVTA